MIIASHFDELRETIATISSSSNLTLGGRRTQHDDKFLCASKTLTHSETVQCVIILMDHKIDMSCFILIKKIAL